MTQIEKNVTAEINMLNDLIASAAMNIESMIESEMYTSEELAAERAELAGFKAQRAAYN